MKLLREVSEQSEANELRQLIQTNCRGTAEAGNIFWRGTGSNLHTFTVRDSASRGARQSLTGNDSFLTWTVYDPKWKNIPRRTNSIIVTNNLQAAAYFGNIVAVIPFDGTKLAVLHGDDMNDANGAFRERITSETPADALSIVLAVSLSWLNENRIIDDDQRMQLRRRAWDNTPATLEEIQRLVDGLDAAQKKEFSQLLAQKTAGILPGFSDAISRTQNILNGVSDMFDPNGAITIFDSTQPVKVESPTSEIWFEGKCILVPVEQPHLHEVLREYKNLG